MGRWWRSPHSPDVKRVLHWAMKNDKFVITLCHGPCGLLAAVVDEAAEDFLFKGYEICVFPDSLDTGANIDIGYIPGPMPWLVGEKLRELGVKINKRHGRRETLCLFRTKEFMVNVFGCHSQNLQAGQRLRHEGGRPAEVEMRVSSR